MQLGGFMRESFTEIITKYKLFLEEIASCDREILRSQRNLKVNTNRKPKAETNIETLEEVRKQLVQSKKSEAAATLYQALKNNNISIEQNLFYNGIEVYLTNICVCFLDFS